MNYKTITTVFFSLVLIIDTLFAVDLHKSDIKQTSADVIVIDSMNVFGNLERPGVTFLHDKHTIALEKQGKDCLTCHQSEKDSLVFRFKRIVDTDKDATLEIYHSNCIGCHQEMADQGQESGPLECGECHQQEPQQIALQKKITFDKSLHYKHIEAANNDCQSCHHGYDPVAKKIAYTKGEEQSCRTCHKEKAIDNAAAYQTVAHQACVSCHQEKLESKPNKMTAISSVQCAACHDETKLAAIKKLEKVPRLDRNQPDNTFIKSFAKNVSGMMDPVPFNHKVHEENVDSCTNCHHETLNACETCHTVAGGEQGHWVTLAQAMHKTESERSCIGCHQEVQQQKDCKGCHELTNTKHFLEASDSCVTCHSVSIEKVAAAKKAGRKITVEQFHSQAMLSPKINFEVLPDDLVIDVLSDKYKGVHFPHRAIVEAMMDRIQGSALAASFHQGENTVCQSCHHNSQDSFNPPPKCISCHSSAYEGKNDVIPGTKAAYHRQCFTCHEAMEIKNPVSTDCVSCHEEK